MVPDVGQVMLRWALPVTDTASESYSFEVICRQDPSFEQYRSVYFDSARLTAPFLCDRPFCAADVRDCQVVAYGVAGMFGMLLASRHEN